jgi:hypothetical protein
VNFTTTSVMRSMRKRPVDDRVFGFGLIGEAVRMLLERKLEGIDPARLVDLRRDRGDQE